MSCWVVPSLAAELWQIPLDHILRRIGAGEIETRVEEGFTFVDVAPNGPRIERPGVPPAERPPTWAPAAPEAVAETITEDELLALASVSETGERAGESADEAAVDEPEDGPEDDTQSAVLGDWRAARRKAACQRIAPPRLRKSA